MDKFPAMIQRKLEQWAMEAAISAAKAQQEGAVPTLVVYPTGLRRYRFSLKNGHQDQVDPRVWDWIKKNGGKVIA